MGVTAVMLAVALGSTGYSDRTPNWPAMCYLTHDFVNLEGEFDKWFFRDYEYKSTYMAIVLCFLSFSYLSRVVQLFPSIQPTLRNYFRSRPSSAVQRLLASLKECATASPRKYKSIFWLFAHRLLLSLYCLSKAVIDLYGSLLWEVCLNQAHLT